MSQQTKQAKPPIKHEVTPTPWQLNEEFSIVHAREDGGFDLIAYVYHQGDYSLKHYQANAALLLAAPDLQEELKLARRILVAGEPMNQEQQAIIEAALWKAFTYTEPVTF